MQGWLLLRSFRHARPLRQSCRLQSTSSPNDSKPYYITTPIFYPNSAPHLGHLYSLVVADIFARYARFRRPDRPVHLITGIDEHGLKIQKAAQAQGMDPLAFCDMLSEHFKSLVQKANISSTLFARTSQRQHCDAVQHLWRQLDSQGLIYKDRHSGWYSVSDECFHPELQVARSVDSSGKEQHISIETGSTVEWMEEENYKFRLSSFQPTLEAHFSANKDSIYPPQHHEHILQSLREDILHDLSVSRPRSRLTWGVPVPGDDEQTIYVWIDALTVYLSSAGYPWPNNGDGYSSGWPPNIQVIGKDILRFHAIYFPAMLAALGLPLPKQLLAHSHWTMDHRKMSKSIGNVVDPISAIDEFGIDVVRFYLADVGGRFKDDVDWSPDHVQAHQTEITSLLGNLLARATSKAIRARVDENKRLSYTADPRLQGRPIVEALSGLALHVDTAMTELRVADALEHIKAALGEANVLMTQSKPWDKATSPEETQVVYQMVLDCLRVCGLLLQPFMPSKSAMLLDALGVPEDCRTWENADLAHLPPAMGVESGVILFPKRTGHSN